MEVPMYYRDPYLSRMKSKVEDVIISGRSVEILLEDTILYPGGGGQPHDTGRIIGKKWKIDVISHKVIDNKIWHMGTITGELIPEPGEVVEISLDWDRRYDFMQQHTAQHLLSATLFRLYSLETEGFQIFDDHSKIEIKTEKLTKDMIENAEIVTNEIAKQGLEVRTSLMLRNEAIEGLRKPPKEGIKVLRIVSIEDYDSVPCGGLHVRNTKEVVPIKILKTYKKTSSVWRIEFVAGYRAFRILNNILEDYWRSLSTLNRSTPPLIKAIQAFEEEFTRKISEEKVWKYKFVEALVEIAKMRSRKLGSDIITALDNIPWELRDSLVKEISRSGITLFLGVSDENKFLIFSSRGRARDIYEKLSARYKVKGGGSRNLIQGIFLDRKPNLKELLESVLTFLSH
ncbi:MAG: hypothetical protein DRN30_05760 [Thermoplasmata archaeon]|nr:MAG: hypothetical protein DRN30_05760 [Thermoplasmata archaeon]